MRKIILINVFSIIATAIFFLAAGETAIDLIPSVPEAMQHFLINFLCYISIPIAIRYVFLRKPIKNKWIAIGILVPIYIGFSIFLNIQRDDLQRNISQRFSMPYVSKTHMLGSPMLGIVMILSYFILRRGHKDLTEKEYRSTLNNETKIYIEGAKGTPASSSPYRDANNSLSTGQTEVIVDEERIYATIAMELETGATDKGLWTRLFAECSGDELQMKVLYIKQRAERLISAERIAAVKALQVKASDRSQCVTEETSVKREKREDDKKPAIPIWRRMETIALGTCLLVLLAGVYWCWDSSGVMLVMLHQEDAEVWVDGAYQGRGSLRLEKMSHGKRVVSTKLSGYVPQEQVVEIVSGRETSVEMDMSPTAPKIGDMWKDSMTGMEFVWVPEGSFDMGSPQSESGRVGDEGPVHRVDVDGFWMGKYEVTNTQYRKWKSDYNSGNFGGISLNGGNQPVVEVSWEEAREYAAWLSGQNGGKYTFSLPSEAQWEYACRAGTTTARYWGDNSDQTCQYANVVDQSLKAQWSDWPYLTHNCTDGFTVTAPVGSFLPNRFGLYDLLGNVWEWCEDIYIADAYSRSDRKNPIYTNSGPFRVFRGGSWYNFPDYVRCAFRGRSDPSDRNYNVGFRLLMMH